MDLMDFNIKRFSVPLYREFKSYCARHGLSIKDGLARAMRALMKEGVKDG